MDEGQITVAWLICPGQAQSCFLIRMDSSSISEHAHEACSS